MHNYNLCHHVPGLVSVGPAAVTLPALGKTGHILQPASHSVPRAALSGGWDAEMTLPGHCLQSLHSPGQDDTLTGWISNGAGPSRKKPNNS